MLLGGWAHIYYRYGRSKCWVALVTNEGEGGREKRGGRGKVKQDVGWVTGECGFKVYRVQHSDDQIRYLVFSTQREWGVKEK